MTDDSQTSPASAELRLPLSWRLLHGFGYLVLILIVVRFVCLFRPFAGRWGFDISPETTFVTEPRLPDGFVDFAGAINARAGSGATPDNNCVVLLLQATGPADIPADQRLRFFEMLGIPPLPESGDYLIDDLAFLKRKGIPAQELGDRRETLTEALAAASELPWHDEEHPEVAELLRMNARPLKLIADASRRTHFFSPIPLADTQLLTRDPNPIRNGVRWGCQLLCARVQRRLANKDVAGAWEDALICHRLARLHGDAPDVCVVLVCYSCHAFACAMTEAIIDSRALTATQARQFLADIDSLAPMPTAKEALDFADRLEALDTECRFKLGLAGGGKARSRWRKERLFDGNAILQQSNEDYDRAIETMRLEDPRERLRKFAEQEQLMETPADWQLAVVRAVIGDMDGISCMYGRFLSFASVTQLSHIRASQMRAEARLDLIRIGLALMAYQHEHGRYPDSLPELAPRLLVTVPRDPCSGDDFIYEPTEDGFILYSIGDNLEDDEGRTYDDEPRGDDIVLRMPRLQRVGDVTTDGEE